MRLIDADKLKKYGFKIEFTTEDGSKGTIIGVEHKEIDWMPTIDPVKHGHWIFGNSLRGYAQCSECKSFTGSWDEDHADNYCSHCGAKMDEVC